MTNETWAEREYREQLTWLITMMSNDGFRRHAEYRAKELGQDAPFEGIEKELKERMKELKSAQQSSGG